MLFQMLRFRKNIEAIRRKSEESPYSYLWITLALIVLVSIAAGYIGSLAPQEKGIKSISVLGLMIGALVLLLAGNLFLGGMISWGLRRQSRKKSWGIQLPDESRAWLFRYGVWAGLAIGMAYQSFLLAIGAILWFLLHFKIGHLIMGSSSLVASGYAVLATTVFYQIPKKQYLIRFVFLPMIAIPVLGIVLAIVLGLIRNHDQAAKIHAELSSKLVRPTVHTPLTTAPNTQTMPTPSTPISHLAPDSLSQTSRPKTPVPKAPHMLHPKPERSFAMNDQYCVGGLPMKVPQQSEWHERGTIVALIPKSTAVDIIFKSQNAVHGFLDKAYRTNQRVLVHPNGYGPDRRLIAVVPASMVVQIGQKVKVDGARASHHVACRYVPTLLVQ